VNAAILFVSNGHGEAAIADRIAREVEAIDPQVARDHLMLVGRGDSEFMRDVGPARAMPSGGLIAMGNVTNIVRDVRGGLIGLTLEQRRFLKAARGRYAAVVAVGDVYALLMALAPGAPVVYVGTAKSVNVAPYGPIERMVLRRARRVFVRDEATAQRLRTDRVDAGAPGNVIVDLYGDVGDRRAEAIAAGFAPAVAVFPGSREHAYDDAAFALDVVRACARREASIGAMISLAPRLDVEVFARMFTRHGWEVEASGEERIPFTLRSDGIVRARAWRGPIGELIARAEIVLGQAGTANEAAAAAGVPVVAFERTHDRKNAWYRMRQGGLLGDALLVLPGDLDTAAQAIGDLLGDPTRRERMGAAGRARMGGPGGAHAIAQAIVAAI